MGKTADGIHITFAVKLAAWGESQAVLSGTTFPSKGRCGWFKASLNSQYKLVFWSSTSMNF